MEAGGENPEKETGPDAQGGRGGRGGKAPRGGIAEFGWHRKTLGVCCCFEPSSAPPGFKEHSDTSGPYPTILPLWLGIDVGSLACTTSRISLYISCASLFSSSISSISKSILSSSFSNIEFSSPRTPSGSLLPHCSAWFSSCLCFRCLSSLLFLSSSVARVISLMNSDTGGLFFKASFSVRLGSALACFPRYLLAFPHNFLSTAFLSL